MASISCESLPLGAPGPGERLVLVRTTDAIRLCREDGYQALPAHRAVDFIERLGRRDMAAARGFVTRARLYSFPLQNLDDASLRALLRAQLRAGELAVLREGEGAAGEDASDVKQRRLVRRIEAKSQGRLSHAGRQYRLVPDSRLDSLADRDYYEVVSRRDAVGVLSALAGQSSDGDLARLLGEAAGMLTQDWRAPFKPDGLVLLRRIIVQHAYKPDLSPALTPSQIIQLAKSDWIEIELVDQDGEPYATSYKLELTDQSIRQGRFGEDGFLGVYEIESGTCKLTIGEPMALSGTEEVEEAEAEPTQAEEEPEEAEEEIEVQVPAVEVPEVEPVESEFSVKVVDEAGNPVAGVPMVFRWLGGEETVPTGSDGVAKCKAAADSVNVSFESAEALALVMTPIWTACRGRPRADWLQACDNRSTVTLFGGEVRRALADPASLRTSQPKVTVDLFLGALATAANPPTISVQPLVIVVRMLAELFDIDKCFLLPQALHTVQELVRLHKEYHLTDVLIVGHTDTSGAPEYNLDLSLERAGAMRAYLQDDADAWLAWYGSNKKESKRWGTTEDSYMIGTLLDGTSYSATLAGYQQWHNNDAPRMDGYDTLAEDGIVGPLTRKQLVLDYMHREDTTVPPGTSIQVHGCGEYFPLESSGETLDTTAADGQYEQEDRRVEVYLFPKELGLLPPLPGDKAERGEQEYPEWRHRSVDLRFGALCGPQMVIGWQKDLIERLPPDTRLDFRCTGTTPQSYRIEEGQEEDGLVKFTFSLSPSRGPCTLVAQAADSRVSIWEDQTIKDNGSPLIWSGSLSDLAMEEDDVSFEFEP